MMVSCRACIIALQSIVGITVPIRGGAPETINVDQKIDTERLPIKNELCSVLGRMNLSEESKEPTALCSSPKSIKRTPARKRVIRFRQEYGLLVKYPDSPVVRSAPIPVPPQTSWSSTVSKEDSNTGQCHLPERTENPPTSQRFISNSKGLSGGTAYIYTNALNDGRVSCTESMPEPTDTPAVPTLPSVTVHRDNTAQSKSPLPQSPLPLNSEASQPALSFVPEENQRISNDEYSDYINIENIEATNYALVSKLPITSSDEGIYMDMSGASPSSSASKSPPLPPHSLGYRLAQSRSASSIGHERSTTRPPLPTSKSSSSETDYEELTYIEQIVVSWPILTATLEQNVKALCAVFAQHNNPLNCRDPIVLKYVAAVYVNIEHIKKALAALDILHGMDPLNQEALATTVEAKELYQYFSYQHPYSLTMHTSTITNLNVKILEYIEQIKMGRYLIECYDLKRKVTNVAERVDLCGKAVSGLVQRLEKSRDTQEYLYRTQQPNRTLIQTLFQRGRSLFLRKKKRSGSASSLPPSEANRLDEFSECSSSKHTPARDTYNRYLERIHTQSIADLSLSVIGHKSSDGAALELKPAMPQNAANVYETPLVRGAVHRRSVKKKASFRCRP